MSRPRSVTALRILAVIGVLYFGLVILLLGTLTTIYNPVTQPASMYGVGPYAVWMNVGFFVGGIGLISFSLILRSPTSNPRSRAGGVLLFISGLMLMMDSYFTTDVSGPTTTTHGIIHAFGGLLFFTTAPIGLLLVARKFGRLRLVATLAAFLVGFYLLGANLNIGGFAERLILLVIFTSVVADALNISTLGI